MPRRLALRREALAELSASELGAVAGAALPSGLTCPVADCFVESNLAPCYTWAC